jgi:hypothetical protein
MKLIDRYVIEVGKRLPLVKGRKDIENELRSTLEDMLEDRSQKSGKPAEDSMEIELLKEYGAPQKVAETYNPTPYLIGPRMFPMFIMVLKIVVAAVSLAMVIVTGIEIATHSPMTAIELAKVIGQGFLNIISASIGAFGNIALVFALIERFAPVSDFKIKEEEEWDPASLMKEPEPQDIKIWEPIAAIVFTFIAISIFNFNPQLIGIYTVSGEKWSSFPILSEAFFRWLPLMNIAWIAEIILNGMLLRAGRWQISSRLFSIAIKVFQIVIGYFLLTGPSIITVTTETLKSIEGFDAEAARILGTMAQQGVHGLIGLIIFITAIDVVKAVYKLITQGSVVTS